MLNITRQKARSFILAHQGLCAPREFKGKQGILDYIRRVGCIQFDPLDVVGRNPELVLQSRIRGFKPDMLHELLYADRRLVDGYDKMMAIYPIHDWPYFERSRESARKHLGGDSGRFASVLPEVREEIEKRGPISSKDLNYDYHVDWPWGPTRLARAVLESMYLWGELVIHHKERTRKVYDFSHRHVPGELLSLSDPNGPDEEYHDWYVLRRIGSMGLLWDLPGGAWLGMPADRSGVRRAALDRLRKRGAVTRISVEGIAAPFYLREEDMDLFNSILNGTDPDPRASILAPLDNLLWDRRLAKELFDFDYSWEVYKPVTERRYGYYVLPVLYGDRFVARFEPGREKSSGAIVIKNWWWEPGIKRTKKMEKDLRSCFKEFMGYLGSESIQLSESAGDEPNLKAIFSPLV